MGVCNVTPDSFSDGGQHFSPDDARARVDALLREGADVVDIGAESTRPGAKPVTPEEQLSRMLDVVRYAAGRAAVSVDTTSPVVAEACLEAGAIAINDVSLLADAALADVAMKAGATLILMHARGPQVHMRGFSQYPASGYGDVVTDVVAEWNAQNLAVLPMLVLGIAGFLLRKTRWRWVPPAVLLLVWIYYFMVLQAPLR